jgi:hypothetical protein
MCIHSMTAVGGVGRGNRDRIRLTKLYRDIFGIRADILNRVYKFFS